MRIAVCGAGGFIGSHLVKRLKAEGHWVRGIDLKRPEFSFTEADEFVIGDLRQVGNAAHAVADCEQVYQLAADMGGAGYIFTGEHDADIMHNSAMCNLNVLHEAVKAGVKRIFYSSSACIYPARNQQDPNNPNCVEDSAYPAEPDSEYGWEKLFSERLYASFARNYGIEVRVARFHNIYGPEGTYDGGREKAPAAMCRKVASTPDGGEIEVWGDGSQTRSFLYIDECIRAVRAFMDGDFEGPVNIGSEEMVTINQLAALAIAASGKRLTVKHIDGPRGVNGRNSDNRIFERRVGRAPEYPLSIGMQNTYDWVTTQVNVPVQMSV